MPEPDGVRRILPEALHHDHISPSPKITCRALTCASQPFASSLLESSINWVRKGLPGSSPSIERTPNLVRAVSDAIRREAIPSSLRTLLR